MNSKLGKGVAMACGMAALLALGACGDGGNGDAAQQAARNGMTPQQQAMPSEDAAARAAAQRSGAAQLSQGSGT